MIQGIQDRQKVRCCQSTSSKPGAWLKPPSWIFTKAPGSCQMPTASCNVPLCHPSLGYSLGDCPFLTALHTRSSRVLAVCIHRVRAPLKIIVVGLIPTIALVIVLVGLITSITLKDRRRRCMGSGRCRCHVLGHLSWCRRGDGWRWRHVFGRWCRRFMGNGRCRCHVFDPRVQYCIGVRR